MTDEQRKTAEQVIAAAMTEHEPPITGLADEYECCAEVVATALREAGLLVPERSNG